MVVSHCFAVQARWRYCCAVARLVRRVVQNDFWRVCPAEAKQQPKGDGATIVTGQIYKTLGKNVASVCVKELGRGKYLATLSLTRQSKEPSNATGSETGGGERT